MNKYFTIADLYLLLAIDEKYRYVARNKNNILYVFEKKPEKKDNCWISYEGQYVRLRGIEKGVLRCAEWTDDKPVWIPPKLAIKNAIAKRLSDAVVMCALIQCGVTTDDV